ncbi:MAG: DUF2207 domain-containing protein, partial [Candidatus Micrarchaeales archaeon]
MKKKIFLFIFLLIIFFIFKDVNAKSYYYPEIYINLKLENDGSVIVTQKRTYRFNGEFSWAYLDLLKKGAKNIELINIYDADTNASPIYYYIDDYPTHLKVTWFYVAIDEDKTFVIVYKIIGAIKRYNDVAEFYWKVIDDPHEKIEHLYINVSLPSPSPNLFKIFVHGQGSSGKIFFSPDNKSAIITYDNIPKNTYVELRILAQPNIFNNTELINQKAYQRILNEESMNYYLS